MTRFLGVDLAWGEGSARRVAKETGVACIDGYGRVLDAGWRVGLDAVAEWILEQAQDGDVVAIDAPLVVTNPTGMRECEREVGRRYGRWMVFANSTNLGSASLGGMTLYERLFAAGFVYDDGNQPGGAGPSFFECYPYTALVGAAEFGYDKERPRYKRPNPALPAADRRGFRATECDGLISRLVTFSDSIPPLDIRSHPIAADLVTEDSPLNDRAYKHREDLLDALICAWTAALWHQAGTERCLVLGEGDLPNTRGHRPAIIAPSRPEQRRALTRSQAP